jgi:hypothetical protein
MKKIFKQAALAFALAFSAICIPSAEAAPQQARPQWTTTQDVRVFIPPTNVTPERLVPYMTQTLGITAQGVLAETEEYAMLGAIDGNGHRIVLIYEYTSTTSSNIKRVLVYFLPDPTPSHL